MVGEATSDSINTIHEHPVFHKKKSLVQVDKPDDEDGGDGDDSEAKLS